MDGRTRNCHGQKKSKVVVFIDVADDANLAEPAYDPAYDPSNWKKYPFSVKRDEEKVRKRTLDEGEKELEHLAKVAKLTTLNLASNHDLGSKAGNALAKLLVWKARALKEGAFVHPTKKLARWTAVQLDVLDLRESLLAGGGLIQLARAVHFCHAPGGLNLNSLLLPKSTLKPYVYLGNCFVPDEFNPVDESNTTRKHSLMSDFAIAARMNQLQEKYKVKDADTLAKAKVDIAKVGIKDWTRIHQVSIKSEDRKKEQAERKQYQPFPRRRDSSIPLQSSDSTAEPKEHCEFEPVTKKVMIKNAIAIRRGLHAGNSPELETFELELAELAFEMLEIEEWSRLRRAKALLKPKKELYYTRTHEKIKEFMELKPATKDIVEHNMDVFYCEQERRREFAVDLQRSIDVDVAWRGLLPRGNTDGNPYYADYLAERELLLVCHPKYLLNGDGSKNVLPKDSRKGMRYYKGEVLRTENGEQIRSISHG